MQNDTLRIHPLLVVLIDPIEPCTAVKKQVLV